MSVQEKIVSRLTSKTWPSEHADNGPTVASSHMLHLEVD